MNQNGSIILPGVLPAQRSARLTGQRTLDGGFRLILLNGEKEQIIDLTPEQTVQMAVGMLRSQGIEVGFASNG